MGHPRRPGSRAQANALLLPLIEQAHRESRQTYGSPRVQHWLQQHGQLALPRFGGLPKCACVGLVLAVH